MDKVFSRFNPRRTPDKNLSELVPAHSAIPSCASEISDSREGEGASKTMRSSDFSSSVSGRTEIKESNFSKLRLRPSNVRLTCVCFRIFSVPLCYSCIGLSFSFFWKSWIRIQTLRNDY